MKIIKTNKFRKIVNAQFEDYGEQPLQETRDRFVNDVRRQAYAKTVESALQLPEYKNVDFFTQTYEPARVGLGVALQSKIGKWSDIESFYANQDKEGAIEHVLQDARELAANPTYMEYAGKFKQNMIGEVDDYQRRNPNGNWSGD